MHRRDFIKYGTVIAGALTGPRHLAAAATQSPARSASPKASFRGDLAVVNAKVMTVEPSQPEAQAILVRGGRIVHVGTSDEVKAKAGDAQLFDAGGRAVVPGFIDAHTHMEVALSHEMYAVDVHVPPLKNIRELQAALNAKAMQTPKDSG